ncbi:putative redox protein [Nitrosomonas nitrosa]|uniref:OsmC family protein n=1 Tax=Nitrosomonas nitrosa TaxID=52442 RepID=UPI000D323CE2|nr:OsmC family protein [Nitrosomonas nitrosa]MCO6433901.1 OsmC family protein [Nitrosomonas nitrosa]PTR04539.1 putative redox protein [Nitrosomonas nitrosa]
MKARIKWQEGICSLGETESGHSVVIDGAPGIGGKNLGPRPMELILLGLGGCSTIDVILILQKSRQEITDCVVEIDAVRAVEDPKVFTDIHMHFIVTGKKLNAHQVERAISLSAEKYCSASIMLKNSVNITHDFEIIEDE